MTFTQRDDVHAIFSTLCVRGSREKEQCHGNSAKKLYEGTEVFSVLSQPASVIDLKNYFAVEALIKAHLEHEGHSCFS